MPGTAGEPFPFAQWFAPRGDAPRLSNDACGHPAAEHQDDGCHRLWCMCAWPGHELRRNSCGPPGEQIVHGKTYPQRLADGGCICGQERGHAPGLGS